MRLDEAYQAWGQLAATRELYKNTKDVFRKATWTLPTNQPCSYYTQAVLTRAFVASNLSQADKAKAASVIVHVLNYAHAVEPDVNPNPGFTYRDITDCDVQTADVNDNTPDAEQPASPTPEPEPTAAPDETKSVRGVMQLNPKTLKVVREWQSAGTAERTLGIKNILRAIERRQLAGGFFWCRLGEEKNFEPAGSRSTKKTKKTAKPKAEKKPKPVPAPEPVVEDVTPAPEIWNATDEEIIDEIRRRGWKGKLTITKTIEFI